MRGTEPGRFWPKVDKRDGGCWVWTAAVRPDGYGIFRRGDGSNIRAHRWAWQEARGPIAPDLELDHLCRNRACVNPDHLEAVTHQENCSRSEAGGRVWRSLLTHCPSGHEYTPANTYHYRGSRLCRECRKLQGRRSTAICKARRAER